MSSFKFKKNSKALGDILLALERLAARTSEGVLFTIAPKTPMLSLMHKVGKIFPRKDRSPAIVPVDGDRLIRDAKGSNDLAAVKVLKIRRISNGFYISQAMGVTR